jgi:aminopeptidase N
MILRLDHLLLLPCAVVCAILPGQSQRNVSGRELIPEEACYDVLHYTLRLSIDPVAKSIEGSVQMRAKIVASTEQLAMDLDPAFTVRGVTVGGSTTRFEHADGRIMIHLAEAPKVGAETVVEVQYGGVPHEAMNPPWDGGFTWQKTPSGAPWIATSCQGQGADLWWPCKDQPSDKPDGVDLFITVPKGLVVASNGTQQGEPEVTGDQATFHWQECSPISNYCVALNIAPYVKLTDTFDCIDGTKMPVQWFVLPESVTKAKRCMPQFLDHVHFLEELLGPYPFRAEKYGIAETPHLGMEHQTILAYGNHWNDEQYDWLHLHELAHEWWGNLVTCRDWKDLWIHEGFASYMQALYREKRFGEKEYRNELSRARTMNRSPVAPREHKNSFEIYFGGGGSNDIYFKGSWILHTLRWELGDDKFFQALREFCYPTEAARKATDGSQCRFVDTEDFIVLCSRLAKQDMHWFFDVYVRQPRLPRLRAEKKDGMLELHWETPGDLPFSLTVPVLLHGQEVRVPMPGGSATLLIGDDDYTVDPELRLLMVRSRGR